MTELRLAEGEEVVRRYGCTAVDGCAVIAGTVVPLRSKKRRESEGSITVTNRRVIYDMEVQASGKRRASSIHQETRIEDISSISSVMAKFGRDIRIPALMVVIGFILIFAPFVWATESGAFETEGDYQDGYNAGVEYGYYHTYLNAIKDGEANTIPPGYSFEEPLFQSPDFSRGYIAGLFAGVERAEADITADRAFSVPTDIMMHGSATMLVLILAIVGAVVFVMGSVLYAISSRTKDWVALRIGSSGTAGPYITSINNADCRIGTGPMTATESCSQMIEEIGSIIVGLRGRTAA